MFMFYICFCKWMNIILHLQLLNVFFSRLFLIYIKGLYYYGKKMFLLFLFMIVLNNISTSINILLLMKFIFILFVFVNYFFLHSDLYAWVIQLLQICWYGFNIVPMKENICIINNFINLHQHYLCSNIPYNL